MRGVDLIARIDAALEGMGAAGDDWSVGPDAMRWTPAAAEEPNAYQRATIEVLRSGVGALRLQMAGGPASGDVVVVPNPGYPPHGYRFCEALPPLAVFAADLSLPPKRAPIHEYSFDNAITADGALRYKYAGCW